MSVAYIGPLGDEPLAIELHNTVYAAGGTVVDGLASAASAQAWCDALAPRLADAGDGAGRGPGPTRHDLVALRDAVRLALHAAATGEDHDDGALEAINRASARAPRSPAARRRPGADPVAVTNHHGASQADIVIGALAADAIRLLTGPHRHQLRVCGAPGCVLMFLKHRARREWCSNACGNRARQARHYARSRRHAGTT